MSSWVKIAVLVADSFTMFEAAITSLCYDMLDTRICQNDPYCHVHVSRARWQCNNTRGSKETWSVEITDHLSASLVVRAHHTTCHNDEEAEGSCGHMSEQIYTYRVYQY